MISQKFGISLIFSLIYLKVILSAVLSDGEVMRTCGENLSPQVLKGSAAYGFRCRKRRTGLNIEILFAFGHDVYHRHKEGCNIRQRLDH